MSRTRTSFDVPLAGPRVVVFGDSIATGQRSPLHLGWVVRLSTALGDDALVVNASVNGDTTRTALLRMAHDVPPTDVLLVQFGINDANVWQTERGHVRVGEGAFRANLREIAERAGPSARVILQTNHETARGRDYDERVAAYNVIVREVAVEVGALLSDIEPVHVNLVDGVHPSVEGHRQYAAHAIPLVCRALRR